MIDTGLRNGKATFAKVAPAWPATLYVTFGHGSGASLLTPQIRGRDTSNSHVF